MSPSPSNPRPLVIVLSGPSGVGKDFILSRLKENGPPLGFITTCTTRPPRPAEVDGQDYRFLARGEFERLLAQNELLEHASVYGYLYGVPKQPVREALARGQDVFLKVDVQGARTIKQTLPEAVLVFLAPPSLAELSARLRGRRTESPADLERRLQTAAVEMNEVSIFDYVIINHNGGADTVVAELSAIVTAEKLRVRPREYTL
jgi:guanylate kinase